MKEFIINKNDADQRLDKFIFKAVKTMPASMLYKAVRTKKIKVNDKKAEISYRLCEGDSVKIYLNDSFFSAEKGEQAFYNIKPDLQIVYEDENILLVNKKSGMICHSDDKEGYNTLIAHITAYLWQKKEYAPDRESSFAPALCNRIDRNTEGIVIAAKNAEALRILNQKIKDREIKKSYLALAVGHFEKKTEMLTNYVTKNEAQNRVYVSDKKESDSSKLAKLRYTVLKEKNNLSLLEIELITGRTHQIRAQLANIGHPLAGDGKYGKNEQVKNKIFRGQALCSYRLEFCFTSESGILSYLNGKIFTVNDIDFVNKFEL